MANKIKIVRALIDKINYGPRGEKVLALRTLKPPDCWHVIQALRHDHYKNYRGKRRRAVQEADAKLLEGCWELCHRLHRHIKRMQKILEQEEPWRT